MTQTKDLIKKMADFFTSEEFYEKGEDARLELSPDDVRCMNDIIKQIGSKRLKEQEPCEDCISREDAIKQCGFGMTNLLIADCLRRLPPVTPQPKIGHWIGNPYCPACRARMIESEEV